MGAPSTSERTGRAQTRLVALVLLALACAGGSKGNDGSYGGAFEEGDDGGATVDDSATIGPMDDSDAGPADDDGDGAPPDLGACQGDGECLSPPGTCWGNGQCVDGMCQLEPLFAGEPCDDGDPCSDPDLCDGSGNCVGDSIPCTAPNASGGMCIAGACQGLTCDPGFGDCNEDWEDGCEITLTSAQHCGGCDSPCGAGAHASADCSTGTCDQACDAPWVDCDDDIANGCEIPEGVPNQCDANGLDPTGCWTAWCGQSNAATAVNFGTWHCMECSTCHVPAGGQCQWCDHASGQWFPAEACACGNWEDLACG